MCLTLRRPAFQFIERSFPSVATSNTLKEAVVSVTTLGAAFGAFTGGFFSDYYGRCVAEKQRAGVRGGVCALSLLSN